VRYGIALPNYGVLATPEHLIRVAQHAEAAGLDSVCITALLFLDSSSLRP
jgi:hypothetical protein